MTNYFIFDNHRSLDYGLQLNKVDTLSAPAREVEVKSIPGRSGELLIDKNRFGSQTVTYEAFFKCGRGEVPAYARRIKSWLLGVTGYRELADTYDRQYYNNNTSSTYSNENTKQFRLNCLAKHNH